MSSNNKNKLPMETFRFRQFSQFSVNKQTNKKSPIEMNKKIKAFNKCIDMNRLFKVSNEVTNEYKWNNLGFVLKYNATKTLRQCVK